MAEKQRSGTDPAGEAAQEVERANQRAERRVEELRDEAREAIKRTDREVKDRDAVGERPVPPKARKGKDQA